MDRSYQNMNSNNNNVNSNNVIQHNYQILSLGNEDIVNVLTLEQKKQIMNSRLGSLEKLVEITHCGEMNQFKNIIITNLKDNYAYRYDEQKGFFVTVTKDVLLDNLVMSRLMDIEVIYDELQSANKIDLKTKKLIQDFLDRMGNDDTPFFDSETKYENFKTYKANNIKILLYNNHDKITKDIALLISNTNNKSAALALAALSAAVGTNIDVEIQPDEEHEETDEYEDCEETEEEESQYEEEHDETEEEDEGERAIIGFGEAESFYV